MITVKLHLWHILSTYATCLYITHMHTRTRKRKCKCVGPLISPTATATANVLIATLLVSSLSRAHTHTHGGMWDALASCGGFVQKAVSVVPDSAARQHVAAQRVGQMRRLTTSDVRRLPFVNIGVVVGVGGEVVSIGIGIDVDVVYLSSSVAAMLQVQGNFGRRATDGGRRMRRQK